MWLIGATFLVCTFLLAAVPTGAVLTALFTDVDLRRQGSGNIGATNVYRLCGRNLGIATLAGDVLKGFVPVLLAHVVLDGTWGISATILVAFLGHCYSPYLGFDGGKGVATAIGGFLAAAPVAAIIAAGAWIGVVAYSRKSSLAALVGLLAMLAALAVLPWARPLLPAAILLGVILIWRHRANIRRLLTGSESRV